MWWPGSDVKALSKFQMLATLDKTVRSFSSQTILLLLTLITYREQTLLVPERIWTRQMTQVVVSDFFRCCFVRLLLGFEENLLRTASRLLFLTAFCSLIDSVKQELRASKTALESSTKKEKALSL
jgi:hypothetical protein